LRKEYVENFTLDTLYDNLFNDVSIKKLSTMLSEYNRKQAESNRGELDAANNELHNVIDKISKVFSLVTETGISISTISNDLKELEERKLYLEKHLRELTLRNREKLITEEMITELISQSKTFVKTKNLSECRAFIKTYINKVTVGETVEIVFNINIPNEKADGVEPIASAEGVKVIQRDYRATANA
jgi:DNA-binding transcriptional MocR family regulator